MKFTNFLRLKKPESTDYVQVEDLNENMDILDSEMEELRNEFDTLKASAVSVLSGTAAPTSSQGSDGDIYLVTE